jgi:hypothetical protein
MPVPAPEIVVVPATVSTAPTVRTDAHPPPMLEGVILAVGSRRVADAVFRRGWFGTILDQRVRSRAGSAVGG